MAKSPKQPKQTDAGRRNERRAMELQERMVKAAERPVEIPKADPVLPMPPPPRESVSDAGAASDQARQRAMKRTNAGRRTLFAGETGGYGGRAATLLG